MMENSTLKRSLTPTRIDKNEPITITNNNKHNYTQDSPFNTIMIQSNNEDTSSKKLKSSPSYEVNIHSFIPSFQTVTPTSYPSPQRKNNHNDSDDNASGSLRYLPDETTMDLHSHLVFPSVKTKNQPNCNTSNAETNAKSLSNPKLTSTTRGTDDESPFSLPPPKVNDTTPPPFIFPDTGAGYWRRSDSKKRDSPLPSLPPISTIFALYSGATSSSSSVSAPVFSLPDDPLKPPSTFISTNTTKFFPLCEIPLDPASNVNSTNPPHPHQHLAAPPKTEHLIDYFDSLPPETILNILKYLSLVDFFRVLQVCRKLYEFSDDESIWTQFLKEKLQETNANDWSNYITTNPINTKIPPNKLKLLKVLGSANNLPNGKSKREYATRLKIDAMWQDGNASFYKSNSNSFGRVRSLAFWGQKNLSESNGYPLALCGYENGLVNIVDTKTAHSLTETSLVPQTGNETLHSVIHIQSNSTGMLCGSRDGWLRQYTISMTSSTENPLRISTQFSWKKQLVRPNTDEARPISRLFSGMATEPNSNLCVAFYGQDDENGGMNGVENNLEREIDIFNCNGLYLRTLEGDVQSGAVSCIGANPVNHLISGSNSGVVKIWDIETGSSIFSVSGHQKRVNCVSLLDNRHIAMSGSADGEVTIFDERAGPNYVRCFMHNKRIVYSFYATQTKLLVGLKSAHNSGFPNVCYWDPRISATPVHTFKDLGSNHGSVVSIVSDETKIVAGRSHGQLTFWGFTN